MREYQTDTGPADRGLFIDKKPTAKKSKKKQATKPSPGTSTTGQTAAELIYSAADAEKLNMGLTTWRNAPEGGIQKSDTTIAKSYLDLAANRAQRGIVMTMND